MRRVRKANPDKPVTPLSLPFFAGIAQLVERLLCKHLVAGSIPVSGFLNSKGVFLNKKVDTTSPMYKKWREWLTSCSDEEQAAPFEKFCAMELRDASKTLIEYYADEADPNRYVSEAWKALIELSGNMAADQVKSEEEVAEGLQDRSGYIDIGYDGTALLDGHFNAFELNEIAKIIEQRLALKRRTLAVDRVPIQPRSGPLSSRKGIFMAHVRPTIQISLHMSSNIQMQPEEVKVETNLQYGEGGKGLLSEYEYLKFLVAANKKILEMILEYKVRTCLIS